MSDGSEIFAGVASVVWPCSGSDRRLANRYTGAGGRVFGTLGMPELILIFVVALLLFGPRKMPQIGRSIGRAMGEFRRASNEFKRTIEDEVAADDIREVEKDLKEITQVVKDPVGVSDLKDSLKESLEGPKDPPGDQPGKTDRT